MGVEEKALGQRLATARRQAGLTQQELCQKAGLSYSTLAKIERGAIRSPSVFTVASIAEATGSSLERLMNMKPMAAQQGLKRTSKTGVKFVYFDVNDTIVRHFQGGFSQAASELGAPLEDIENLFWRYNDELCRAHLTIDEFNKKMAQNLGVKSFDWHRYYMNNVKAMPGIGALLGWVSENYEIGLFSNHAKGFIKDLIKAAIIPDLPYKTIIDSSEIGHIKPDPAAYKLAQQKAGMEPGEILLVDDTRNFLTAGDRAGWQIVWFNELEPEKSIERVRKTLKF